MNRNAKIAELVLRAQTASDGGKGIKELRYSQRSITDNRAGYGVKDHYIISAINLINGGRSNWKYAVVKAGDFMDPAWIVYFETRVDGDKIQISFHTFNSYFRRFTRKSFRTKWDHGCSRDSALTAYVYYVPNGRY